MQIHLYVVRKKQIYHIIIVMVHTIKLSFNLDLPYMVMIEVSISVLNTCTFAREIKRVLSPSHCYILHVIVWQVFINPYFMVFGICLVLIFTSWSYALMPTLYMQTYPFLFTLPHSLLIWSTIPTHPSLKFILVPLLKCVTHGLLLDCEENVMPMLTVLELPSVT